jgi:type II secretory pathway pseudopilin PulG
MNKKKKKKLTICDWCVLVGVFGMMVSVFTPGLTQAMEEQKLSDMVDNLQIIRSQIMLYKAENHGLLPGQKTVGGRVTAQSFAKAMGSNRKSGQGAYLRSIPVNPYVMNGNAQNSITCVNDPAAKPGGDEGTAWWFNAATGEFHACDSAFHTAY